jgi:hypothetical protein
MRLLREAVGGVIGTALAPVANLVSHCRGARTFHPDGLVFKAKVTPVNDGVLSQRLAGAGLVRCSGALWREGHQWPDVLGVALRILDDGEARLETHPKDQDLLFATILSPLTMPFAPFTTDVSDFFSNHYWAVAPFDAPGLGRVKLRLTPLQRAAKPGDRATRLRVLLREGHAGFTLEARQTFTLGWHPVARVELERELWTDQRALEFSPFHTGRGLIPVGFVHALRAAVYPASQRGREAA